MVDLYIHRCPAQFAFLRQEPLYQLNAVGPESLRLLVYEDGLPFPLQGYATELRRQWAFPVAPLHHNLEASPLSMLGFHGAQVAPYYFPTRNLELVRKSFGQRFLHYPLQLSEVGHVLG